MYKIKNISSSNITPCVKYDSILKQIDNIEKKITTEVSVSTDKKFYNNIVKEIENIEVKLIMMIMSNKCNPSNTKEENKYNKELLDRLKNMRETITMTLIPVL